MFHLRFIVTRMHKLSYECWFAIRLKLLPKSILRKCTTCDQLLSLVTRGEYIPSHLDCIYAWLTTCRWARPNAQTRHSVVGAVWFGIIPLPPMHAFVSRNALLLRQSREKYAQHSSFPLAIPDLLRANLLKANPVYILVLAHPLNQADWARTRSEGDGRHPDIELAAGSVACRYSTRVVCEAAQHGEQHIHSYTRVSR